MTDYIPLKKTLEQSLSDFRSLDNYYTGRMNNILLQKLLANIYNNPTHDNFFHFVNCLDFLYSSGLKYKDKNQNTKLKVTTILFNNWDNGLCLKEIKTAPAIHFDKLDSLRNEIKHIGDYYSFTTKVFHQMNSDYFIWDKHVVKFMLYHNFLNTDSKKTTYRNYYEQVITMKNEIHWDKSHDELDISIWMYVDNNKSRYLR